MLQFRLLIFAFQGLLLLGTALFVKYATRKSLIQNRRNISITVALATYLTFVAIFFVASKVNIPHFLHETDAAIVAIKNQHRETCTISSKNADFKSASTALYDNSLGKELYNKFLQSHPKSLKYSALEVINPLFFGSGAMYSINPYIIMLVISFILKKTGRSTKISSIFPVRLQAITHPIIYAITSAAVAVFFIFHFVVDESRLHHCVQISGHWYTYTMTSLLSTLALAHIANTAGVYSGYTSYYAAWWALYQALTLQVLQNTQRFFHDSVEAKAGIEAALWYSPIIVGIYLGVEVWNRGKFEHKKKEYEKSRKEIQTIPDEYKTVLQAAGVKPQALMDPEFVGFLKGTVEDILKAQSTQTQTQPTAQTSAQKQPVQAEPVAVTKPATPPTAPPVPPPVAPSPPKTSSFNSDLPPPITMEGAPLPLGELPPPPALNLPPPKPQPAASIDALLASIRTAKPLKKVDTNAPRPAAKPAPSSNDIGSLLHKALEQRRAHLEEVEPETEETSSDEWD